MNLYLSIAAVLTFITWGVHTFIGTRDVAGPLLASDIEPVAKFTNYYCWHITTIVLGAMSGGYLYAAAYPQGWDVGLFVTLLSGGFFLYGLALIVQKGQATADMPQWVAFAVITAVSVVGLL